MKVRSSSKLGVTQCSVNFIYFQSNLTGHKNLIEYIDSSIVATEPGVHEVYLLMPYHKVNTLTGHRCDVMITLCSGECPPADERETKHGFLRGRGGQHIL